LLAQWVVWGLVIVLSATLLGLVAGSVFLTRMRAESAVDLTTAGPPEPTVVQVTPPPVVWEGGNPAANLTTAFALPRLAWVTEGPLVLRQGPSTDEAFLATLPAKTGVTVDGFSEDGAWSHLAEPNSGWVSNQYLSFLTDDAAQAMVMIEVRQAPAPAPIVVRALPGPDGVVVGEITAGAPMVAVATTLDGQWRQVIRPVPGWVAAHEFPAALE
jgi:hypothetical protein